MTLLIADSRGQIQSDLEERFGWGRLCTRRLPRPPCPVPWALDNGAFAARHDPRGPRFERFLALAETAGAFDPPPMFAAAPDLPGAGAHSLTLSHAWTKAHPLPQLVWYLVLNDGCEAGHVRQAPDRYQGIMLAGSDDWKYALAGPLQNAARERGWRCHWARCGTPRALRTARRLGFDSGDTALPLLHAGARLRLIDAWTQRPEGSPPHPLTPAENPEP